MYCFLILKIDSDPSLNKLHVTLMISHHCALVLLAMFGSDMYEPWNLECELTHVCHFSSLYRQSCMADLKQTNKKKNMYPCVIHCECFLCPSRGHRSCQLLIFLKATKHTPVNVCERLSVCVCVFIGVGRLRICLALSELQREQFGQL